MKNNYIIGRSNDCDIISNATDKPIELWMHHFHARSLIINLKTGDILTYLFSDGSCSSAQSNFENSPISQLDHNVFIEQDGEKVLFILKTNYKSPAVNRYVENMQERGIEFAGEIISNIEEEFSEFKTYRFGEISSGFVIDLTNPSIIKTLFGEESGEDKVQDIVTQVGSDSSTLPEIKELEQLYFKYSNIGKLIAWADDRLPEQLSQSDIDLSDLSGISGYIADAITLSMEKERPFSSNHLYDLKYSDYILNTLSFIKEKGMDSVVVSSLFGIAANELAQRILQLNEYKEGAEEEFFNLASMAQKFTPYSLKFVLALDEEIREECYMQMEESLVRLQRVMFIKVKDFEFEQEKLAINNIKLLNLELPESIH